MRPEVTPLLSFRPADLERDDHLERQWELSVEWLREALLDTPAAPTDKPGQLTISVFKTGADLVVRGTLQVEVELECARTLDPALYQLRPELFLVLRKAAEPQRPARAERHPTNNQKKEQEAGRLLDDEDAALETYTGDIVDLSPFVREQILLDLPMFPLRSDLRSPEATAMRPPPDSPPARTEVDPRLAPLQAIAEKLKAKN